MAKQGNKHLATTFFKTLFLSVVVFVLLCLALLFGYAYFIDGPNGQMGEGVIPGLKKSGNILTEIFEPVPERINFLLLGTDDDGTRTDFMLAGSYLPKDAQVSLVSIPRDTMVTMPEERLSLVKTYNNGVPSDGVMKLCEVHHHAGEENGVDFAVKQIEELLNIDLDYYAEINLEGFRYFVDAVGGVEFDVPQRMYYNDPTQNLLINLQPGVQVLDGKSAEGLVRFRYGYSRSDLDRMETQQNFIKAMAAQALSKENILKNIPSIASAAMQYTKTNFGLADVPKYLKYVKNLTPDRLYAYTLPSVSKKMRGKDFQILDEEGAREIIQKAFYEKIEKTGGENPNPGQPDEGSFEKSIQVLNGGYTAGLAAKYKGHLAKDGYKVSSVSDYQGEKQAATRIIVKRDGEGKDLLPYFTNGKIEVDQSFTNDYDIVIVLGTAEK